MTNLHPFFWVAYAREDRIFFTTIMNNSGDFKILLILISASCFFFALLMWFNYLIDPTVPVNSIFAFATVGTISFIAVTKIESDER